MISIRVIALFSGDTFVARTRLPPEGLPRGALQNNATQGCSLLSGSANLEVLVKCRLRFAGGAVDTKWQRTGHD